MTAFVILNVVLAALVVTAIVGGLAWSIATQNLDAITGSARSPLRRRRTTARAQLAGRPIEHRA